MTAPRVPLIAGNWKMHLTIEESRGLAEEVVAATAELVRARQCRIGLFPTALSLTEVAAVVRRAASSSDCSESAGELLVGAQNMHYEPQGAFTGEISGRMIHAAGGNSVILGHSERRNIFSESNGFVGKKVKSALDSGLVPILCVGERIEERDAGRTIDVVREQLVAALDPVKDAAALKRVIIAYEPVWAIGSGRTATPTQAQEVHKYIRAELGGVFAKLGAPAATCSGSLVLYGGSVKPENARALFAEEDIDGALVGGASLEVRSFAGICEAAIS